MPAPTGTGSVIPQLTPWGLSADADLLYRALTGFGPASTHALGRQLGLPQRRTVSGLEELAAIGAIQAAPARSSSGIRWRAAPPARVLDMLRSRPRRSAALTRHGMGAALTGGAMLGQGIRHLPTRQAARERLSKLVELASSEHLAMNPEPSFDPQAARAGVSMDRALLRRGVRMNVLGVQPVDVDPLAAYGRAPGEASPCYRQADSVPMKLIVVDRKVALFPVSPSDYASGYLEVAQPSVVEALVSLFLTNWNRAQAQTRRMPSIVLSERERELVLLLAAGHTDATAAAELRVSPRTVSGMLRQMMDRLGVENRFQLGLVLGSSAGVHPVGKEDQEEEN